MTKIINFDMDGTLANLYGVNGWLEDLQNGNVRPYAIAKPMVNLSALARQLNRLQKCGYEINIISWLAKCGNDDYNNKVEVIKRAWLERHLPSVSFNNIYIVKYGTPKQTIAQGLLFDDEEPNRKAWGNGAYDVDNILEILRGLR